MTSLTDPRALAPFRKDPAHLIQILPSRRVSLGWVIYHLAALTAVFGFLGFTFTIFILGAGR